MTSQSLAGAEKIVIAHRGASGYLPEHSFAAKAMAYAMGADYLEQDLVMTRDDELVVLHDRFLDRVTNVAKVFPGRERPDGRNYVIDFTLAEIKQLEMTEGFKLDGEGNSVAKFPTRFPIWASSFRVNTFAEEIELIQGLNHSTGRQVGIYPEIKSPWFHKREGKDISVAVLRVLRHYGYAGKTDLVFLQCFDPAETRRIDAKLMPAMGMDLKLVQLIALSDWQETMEDVNGKMQPYSYDWMLSPGAMTKIAEYADAIGPWAPMIVRNESTADHLIITHIVTEAHAAGLLVHPYTFRTDKGHIPPYAGNFNRLLEIFYQEVGVDGLFTDYPDKAVMFLQQLRSKTGNRR